jgi:hypothetical protein
MLYQYNIGPCYEQLFLHVELGAWICPSIPLLGISRSDTMSDENPIGFGKKCPGKIIKSNVD